MQLRPDQTEALANAHSAVARGARRVLLVAPTGFGKTITLGEAARRAVEKKKRVAWFAHRRELVRQAARTLERFGLEQGEYLQIATVQSGRYPDADLVILDEAHHYVADEWAELPARYPTQVVLGGTATPERGDGRRLGALFQAIVVGAQISELQERGTLVPLDIRRPKRQLQPNELAQRPADAWVEAGRPRAVVFADRVERAQQYKEELIAAGARAVCIFGTTEEEERDAAVARLESGELDVLVNVNVLTEGWDCPPVSCCILARGAGSFSMLVQMVGRVLRSHPDKSCALLLDLKGVTYSLGRPDADANYSLDGPCGMWRKGAKPGERFCPICQTLLGDAQVCPTCGKDTSDVKPLRIVNETLVYWKDELQKDSVNVRQARLEKWVREAGERTRLQKTGKWTSTEQARFKFKAVYGYMPRQVDFYNAQRKAIGNAIIAFAEAARGRCEDGDSNRHVEEVRGHAMA